MEYSAPSADTSQNKEELLKSRLRHDIGATVAACLAITCGALMAFYKTGNVFSVAMVAHVILAYTFAMIMDSGNQVAGKIRILERGDASETSESPNPGHIAHQGFLSTYLPQCGRKKNAPEVTPGAFYCGPTNAT